MNKKQIIGTSIGVVFFIALITAEPVEVDADQSLQPEKSLKADKAEKEIKSFSEPTLRKGFGICDSEESFDEFSSAIGRSDSRTLVMLEKQGRCTLTQEGLKFSLLDQTWTGVAKVRVWLPDGNHLDAYTYIEATQGAN